MKKRIVRMLLKLMRSDALASADGELEEFRSSGIKAYEKESKRYLEKGHLINVLIEKVETL